MRSPSSPFVRRVVAGGVGLVMTAAMTLAGVAPAEAADSSCVSGVCTVTFAYTGAPESWVVPTGVASVTAAVSAGSGGQATSGGSAIENDGGTAGLGGSVQAVLPVDAGETLQMVVGGAGQDGVTDYQATPATGGYGGGASAGKKNVSGEFASGGGGGSSFIFGAGPLLVAAGGGGGASVSNGTVLSGGNGGSSGDGSTGGASGGLNFSGRGATTSGRGDGGPNYWSGWTGSTSPASNPSRFGTGGAGADNYGSDTLSGSGAGGGGGFFGGGGGGTSRNGAQAGAGGGGSGFVTPSATDIRALSGNSGDGKIVLTYSDPNYATTTRLKVGDNPNDAAPTQLTATVSPAAATGSVSFSDGATDLGTATLTNGTAIFSKVLSAGLHTITAVYPGDSSHGPSNASATVIVTAFTEAPAFGDSSTSDSPIEKTVVVGQSFSFTDLAATGTPAPTYTVKNDDNDDAVLPKGVTFDDGVLTGSSKRAGTWQIAITATNSVGTATEHVRLTIDPGSATGLEAIVQPGATGSTAAWLVATDGAVTDIDAPRNSTFTTDATITADQGDTIVFETMPLDSFGNPLAKGNVQPVTTSSIDTDTITYDPATNLTTVRFNHASPHVITFTAYGVTNSFTVQVTPTSTPGTGAGTVTDSVTGSGTSGVASTSNHLASTGSTPLAPLGWALGILAAGIAVTLLQRRRTAR